ncbi:MAG TPA: 50S ribosomal protein L18 [Candidatus Woesebacteria bacterium]|nr:50S ribosomal protein L18 [Candidatus Woesebacteria bacterium]
MNKVKHYRSSTRRALSVRSKIFGTKDRPRLSVSRSNQHISLQVIDDQEKRSLIGVSDIGKTKSLTGTKTQRAEQVAKLLAQEMHKAKIKKIVFDRGSYRYHGRVKKVAETLREEGIDF